MKENLYTLRNDLCKKSKNLRTLKFDDRLKNKNIDNLIKEQDKIYTKWKLLDTILKLKEKEKIK